MQLCLNALMHILTLLMEDAVVQRCTGFTKMGSKGRGGTRAMEKTNLELPKPKVFAVPSTWPETTHSQLLSKSP